MTFDWLFVIWATVIPTQLICVTHVAHSLFLDRMAAIQILMRIELWIADISWFQTTLFYKRWHISLQQFNIRKSVLQGLLSKMVLNFRYARVHLEVQKNIRRSSFPRWNAILAQIFIPILYQNHRIKLLKSETKSPFGTWFGGQILDKSCLFRIGYSERIKLFFIWNWCSRVKKRFWSTFK